MVLRVAVTVALTVAVAVAVAVAGASWPGDMPLSIRGLRALGCTSVLYR